MNYKENAIYIHTLHMLTGRALKQYVHIDRDTRTEHPSPEPNALLAFFHFREYDIDWHLFI